MQTAKLKPVEAVISQLLTPQETATALHLKSVGTLAIWRATKRYPLRFVRIGRKIFYRVEDVQAFIVKRTTNETGPCDQRWRDKKPRRKAVARG
jgi:hypothetical protein